jgi:hypothetical protein
LEDHLHLGFHLGQFSLKEGLLFSTQYVTFYRPCQEKTYFMQLPFLGLLSRRAENRESQVSQCSVSFINSPAAQTQQLT